jgi:hypothetical protein
MWHARACPESGRWMAPDTQWLTGPDDWRAPDNPTVEIWKEDTLLRAAVNGLFGSEARSDGEGERAASTSPAGGALPGRRTGCRSLRPPLSMRPHGGRAGQSAAKRAQVFLSRLQLGLQIRNVRFQFGDLLGPGLVAPPEPAVSAPALTLAVALLIAAATLAAGGLSAAALFAASALVAAPALVTVVAVMVSMPVPTAHGLAPFLPGRIEVP